jgi:hypothetical protein
MPIFSFTHRVTNTRHSLWKYDQNKLFVSVVSQAKLLTKLILCNEKKQRPFFFLAGQLKGVMHTVPEENNLQK